MPGKYRGIGQYNDRYRQIGRAVTHFRIRKLLSQEELAYRLGVTRSYISKIEAPGSNYSFSLDILFAISDELGVDICTLLTFKNE